ncbi:hypothetical protein BMA10247_A1875 [Burkholderia mallei NCTC 10247]|uniref:Uncharacterized protein n=1 Tax=Burkholderia mallei (strain NCTC 10229) TaxID=412022 RepID=A2RYF1_BURM9|nr:hypothetical protein BMA10229_0906 [Burkholderia mallei NCTC 10229]ABO03766.1 hypothetical protein BMA10247_A1875 [Burkholderia mallei NCTC 10247]EEP83776.1 hypothetical protein BMAGB8_A0628 [Burkholderia mallei GB8 horse 4]
MPGTHAPRRPAHAARTAHRAPAPAPAPAPFTDTARRGSFVRAG